MVDLSQSQPLKPKTDSTSVPPASDKPPVSQQPTGPPQPAKKKPAVKKAGASLPQMKGEEKIATPEQEEVKKELSELGISPPGRSNKTRVLLATLGVLLLIITLPAAIYLVRQRQEIRKQAYVGQPCTIDADCDTNEECVGGVCVAITPSPSPTPSEGFCGTCSGNKSEGWIGGNQGPVDCDGEECNEGGWNYCCWDEDGDGSCDICARGPGPGVECDEASDCINLSGLTPGTVVKFCRFYANYDVTCPYSTGGLDCFNVTAPDNGRISRCIPAGKCGQLEADGYCGVCKETGCGDGNGNGNGGRSDCNEPPTAAGCKPGLSVYNGVCRNPSCLEEADCVCPPPPGCFDQCGNDNDCPGSLVCQNSRCVNVDCPQESDCLCEAACEYCKVFDENWNEITDLSTITVGQVIRLATFGSTSHAQGITKARFRINGGDWMETTDRYQNMFYIEYIIPEAGSYTIESMVYNPGLGWY